MLLPASYAAVYLVPRVNRKALSHATGFVAFDGAKPILLTARHVVTGRHNLTGKLLSSTGAEPDELVLRFVLPGAAGPEFDERTEPLFAGNRPRWVEHPTLGRRMDAVALRLTNTDKLRVPTLNLNAPLGDEDPPIAYGPADPVSVVGYPFGLDAGGFAIWATGFVASEPSVDFQDTPVLLVDCRSRRGQSGSPVLLQRNYGVIILENGSIIADGRPRSRLLGLYSGRVKSKSDIGIVWKTSALRELLAHATGGWNG
jgi:hypothetical protein